MLTINDDYARNIKVITHWILFDDPSGLKKLLDFLNTGEPRLSESEFFRDGELYSESAIVDPVSLSFEACKSRSMSK